MNKALFIISLQHELAMAIGNELDLKTMLKVFLKVSFNRLNLTSAHIYTYTDDSGLSIKLTAQQSAPYQHLLSLPKRKNGQPWPNNDVLKNFAKTLDKQQQNYAFQCENKQYLFGFMIPLHGLLILETHYPIEEPVQKALAPILQKLATSCYTSIVHDSLVQEVHSRQIAEEKVAFQAQHDGLTGLFNRQHLSILLDNAIANTGKNCGCVIFIDLNRFKPINDSMGHTVGDKILITLAKRLHSLNNSQIDVARFGGDEFILLIKEMSVNYRGIIAQTIDKINQLLSIPFVIDDSSYKLNCSLGYALFPQQGRTVNSVIKFADIAMYEAKKAKTLQGLKYHKSMSDKINKRLAYVEEMKLGLARNDFKLYYQAQYNHNGDIIGAEALLRWLHPIHGIESPAVYIPIAEESNLILAIGQWVLEQACRDIYQLEQQSLPKYFKKVAINVSAKQLIQHDFREKVLHTVKQHGICPSHLSLELTENLLVENIEHTIELIRDLKAQKIDCAIDDFGTGYSSLSYLKRIPASVLKIDRSFVTNIDKSKDSEAIASMIISLAKTLHMKVLAEGVETQEELHCLKSLGCYNYQGFYFSKPMPFDDFVALLALSKVPNNITQIQSVGM
jgi:diguanylate cyclase (GGDEF)-like protein